MVLFVAYHFHPDLEIGAMRSVKFAKYLPAYGWLVHVVSAATENYERTDPTPLSFRCAVHRSSVWPTLLTYRKWRSRRRHTSVAVSSEGRTAPVSLLPTRAGETKRPTPYWKRLLMALAATPDIHVGWLIPGTWLALKLVRREGIDVIYTSGPPHTCHLIGLFVSYITGRPLVADFRDPWTTRAAPVGTPERLAFRLGHVLEKQVVRRCALVLASTPGIRDALIAGHGPAVVSKCVALLNGFDAEDFPNASPPSGVAVDDVVSFVYTGTLYAGRNPESFLAALGELIADGHLRRGSVVVDFYGSVEIDSGPLRQVIHKYSLDGLVSFREPVRREEYLRVLREAAVLILIQGDETPWAIPGKSFEYLATGNEILLLAGSHAVAELLCEYENVHRADPDDVRAIKTCIVRIVERIRSGKRNRAKNVQSLSHMHKRELTRDFARLLDSVVASD